MEDILYPTAALPPAKEDPSMRFLERRLSRFAAQHPRFGIPDLMRYVVIGQAIVYALFLFTGRNLQLLSFLDFNLEGLRHGEVWRLVTFIFQPNAYSPLSFVILLSFYYFVGTTLERTWGTCRFTLYYLSGMLLSVLGTAITALLSRDLTLSLSSAYYLNLTLFLAFAVLYPDARINFWFILPLKASWIAIADAVLILCRVVMSILGGDLIGIVMPVVALLNFLLFFWSDLGEMLGFLKSRTRQQTSPQTIQFKKAAAAQQREEKAQGYRHKCEVCGRTDADYPDLQFRYCSRCAGYHCYCEDHIFNHTHITE